MSEQGATRFALVPLPVLERGLRAFEVAAYVSLASFSNKYGDCHPGVEAIAKRAGLGATSTRQLLEVLATKGLVVIERGKRNGNRQAPNTYRLPDVGAYWGQFEAPCLEPSSLEASGRDGSEVHEESKSQVALSSGESPARAGNELPSRQTLGGLMAAKGISLDERAKPSRAKKTELSDEEKAFYQDIKTAFEVVSGTFADYKREGAAIKRIMNFAAREAPDDPRGHARHMLMTFRTLTTSDDRYWSSQPFIPSVLASGGIWPRVKKELGKERDVRNSEAPERRCRNCGASIPGTMTYCPQCHEDQVVKEMEYAAAAN